MTTPPTQLPTWATSPIIDPIEGGINLKQPEGTLQTTGYVTGNKPAASTFNWLFNLQGEWISYLAAVASSIGTLTAKSSDGSASLLIPNPASVVVVAAGNEAGSYCLYVGYQTDLATPATLTSIGGGTISVTAIADGIVSAVDAANPTSPMTMVVISAVK